MASYLDTDLAIAEVDPDTGQIKATPYFEDYLYNLVFATGGEGADTATTVISSVASADKVSFLQGLVFSLRRKVAELEQAQSTSFLNSSVRQLLIDNAKFDTKIVSTNYTAKNKDYVEARGGITLKFPANAVRGDEVIFANGDGSHITLDGNGNSIKYTSTDTRIVMRRKGTSLHFHFFEDNVLDERYWRAR